MWILVLNLLAACLNGVVGQARTVTITNPLEGDVGSSLQISCSLFVVRSGERVYENPNSITIRTGAVIYDGNGRLTSSTNATHKTYTLENLMQSDDGTSLNCGIAEFVSESVTIEVFYAPTVSRDSTEDVVVTPDMDSTISFTVDANPATVNRVERVDSAPVPSSITATSTGNMVTVSSVGINDGGTYRFIASNRAGNAMIEFVIVVEFAAIYTATVSSEEITCTSPGDSSHSCAIRRNTSGSLNCSFQSNPPGRISYMYPPTSSLNTSEDGSIDIISADHFAIGNYTCVVNNTVLGQPRSTTRKFVLYVGDPPVAVEGNNATVSSTENTVTIRWTYPGDNSIPVSFNVSIRPLSSQAETITRTVPAGGETQVVVSLNELMPSTDYRATITAVNLLASGQARDATFSTPPIGTVPTATPGTMPTVTDSSTRTATSLTSILLLLLCTLTFL